MFLLVSNGMWPFRQVGRFNLRCQSLNKKIKSLSISSANVTLDNPHPQSEMSTGFFGTTFNQRSSPYGSCGHCARSRGLRGRGHGRGTSHGLDGVQQLQDERLLFEQVHLITRHCCQCVSSTQLKRMQPKTKVQRQRQMGQPDQKVLEALKNVLH